MSDTKAGSERHCMAQIPGGVNHPCLESLANVKRSVAQEIAQKLRARAARAYCDGADMCKRAECLGKEAKLKSGEFGEKELKAHQKARELFGEANGLWNQVAEIEAEFGLAGKESQ